MAQTVRDLDVEEARQDGGSATVKEVLFDSLRLDLEEIARTARAIDAGEPGFADRFRSPAGVNQKALLTAADAFARELADLADDIAAIRSADADMQSDDQTGVASTAAVPATRQEARRRDAAHFGEGSRVTAPRTGEGPPARLRHSPRQSAPVGRLRVGSEARRCSEARRRTDVRQCCARFWRRDVAMRG